MGLWAGRPIGPWSGCSAGPWEEAGLLLAFNGVNSVTTTTPDPYEFIVFGGGSGQNPYEFKGALTTTTTES